MKVFDFFDDEYKDMEGIEHCCDMMTYHVEYRCDNHTNPYECPDSIVLYQPMYDEYGIIVFGSASYILIQYCPWCGKKLPESKRDQYFEEIRALGFDDVFEEDLPEKYKSDKWYRDK